MFHALIRPSEGGARPLLKEWRASLTPLHASAGVATCISSPNLPESEPAPPSDGWSGSQVRQISTMALSSSPWLSSLMRAAALS